MKRRTLRLTLLGLSLLSAGCGPDQRRPEGPPPEYQPRPLTPWPPRTSVPPAPTQPAAVPIPVPTATPTPASADAGVAPPESAAAATGLCCDAGLR